MGASCYEKNKKPEKIEKVIEIMKEQMNQKLKQQLQM